MGARPEWDVCRRAKGPPDDEWVRGVACSRAVLLLNTGRLLIQRDAFQFREFVQFGEKTASIWRGLSTDVLTVKKSVLRSSDEWRLTNVTDLGLTKHPRRMTTTIMS